VEPDPDEAELEHRLGRISEHLRDGLRRGKESFVEN
jgi:hypothetical protein